MKTVLIINDTERSSFVCVGNLYEKTFKKLGWSVQSCSIADRPSDGSRFDFVFHNVNGRNFEPLAQTKNIALLVHEWSHYPPEWVPYLNGFDAVWTTTNHSKEIAERSGLGSPAYWLPPALDLEENYCTKESQQAAKPFRFLYVGASHFRKGLHLLLAAWQQAFPVIGMAQLTLKTNAGCSIASPRADIRIITDQLSHEQLCRLYTQHDCYVSASIGEGWGLPVAEAIMAQLPVCANLWGGHGSMITADCAFAIAHQEIPQPYASSPELYAPEQSCGFSNVENIAVALKGAAESSDNERIQKTTTAKHRLLERYGYQNVAKKISDWAL